MTFFDLIENGLIFSESPFSATVLDIDLVVPQFRSGSSGAVALPVVGRRSAVERRLCVPGAAAGAQECLAQRATGRRRT